MRFPSAPTHQKCASSRKRATALRSVTRIARPSGKRLPSVARSIQGCAATRLAIGARSRVTRLDPLHAETIPRMSSVRVRVFPATSKRRSAKRGPARNFQTPKTATRTRRAAATSRSVRDRRGLRGGAERARRNGASRSWLATAEVLLAELHDVPGAQGQQHVPGLEVPFEEVDNIPLFRHIAHGRTASISPDRGRYELSRHSRKGL